MSLLYRILITALCSVMFIGCSSSLVSPFWADNGSSSFSSSGTLIVSAQVAHDINNQLAQLELPQHAPTPGILLGYFTPECRIAQEEFQTGIDAFHYSPLDTVRSNKWKSSGSLEITSSIASLIDFDHIGAQFPRFLALTNQHSTNLLSSHYAESGTLALLAPVPATDSLPQLSISAHTLPGILLGYIPPVVGFIPASNQIWGELDRETKTLTILRGQSRIAVIAGQGEISLDPGTYAVQHKLRKPKWFAPDSYFEKRGLDLPEGVNPPRYRRGALGNYALYVTTDWAIHSSMEYSPEVGGFRVGQNDLASVYYLLPVGSSIRIK